MTPKINTFDVHVHQFRMAYGRFFSPLYTSVLYVMPFPNWAAVFLIPLFIGYIIQYSVEVELGISLY